MAQEEERHGGCPYRQQNPDKSLTAQEADVLASVVAAEASAKPSEMLWAGAERPDCLVVASPAGPAAG